MSLPALLPPHPRRAFVVLLLGFAGMAALLLLAPQRGAGSGSDGAALPPSSGASGVPQLPWPKLPHGQRARAPGPAIADPADDSPRVTQGSIDQALAYTITLEGDGIYGTGFLIDPARGLAVTAWHVVSDMKAPRATFYDGRVAPARLVASDKRLDLALLELPPQKDLPAPELGDVTALRPGDEVFAVGAPRKLGFTVSRGIVSFVGRTMEGARYLQADMSINDGNSGGPVIDARGRIIGVISFIYRRAQGLSFALPINYVVDRWADRLEPASVADRQRRAAYLERFAAWQKLTAPGPLRSAGAAGSD